MSIVELLNTTNINLTHLSALVALLAALSMASERLVEIIKGIVPFLDKENPEPAKERLRKAALQSLAVVAGIVTTYLALPAALKGFDPGWSDAPWIIAIGFLASSGSGVWNSVATFLNKVKDIKKHEAERIEQKPAIKSLSQAAVAAGKDAELIVNGMNFVEKSVVTLAGKPVSSTFVSALQLRVSLKAAEIASRGTFELVVVNPPPAGPSNPVSLVVE